MTPTDSERDLLGAISEADILSLAALLIEAGGENPGDTERRTAAVLARHTGALGFDVEIVEVAPGRPNVIVSVGPIDLPGILFVGHSDVVPAGGGWASNPFSPVVRDGRLIGRGACDMKGGVAAVVAAMDAARRRGNTIPMTLALLVDEEDTGLGIRAFVAGAHARRYSHCVVAEPTDLVAIMGCRGAANLEIAVTGRSAHAGRPSNGRNAISAAARIAVSLETMQAEFDASAHPLLGPATWNIGTISGGTGTSMVADRCVMTIDRRLLPDEDAEDVAAVLRERIAGTDIEWEGIDVQVSVEMSMPGFVTSVDDGLVTSALAAVADTSRPRGCDIWTASCDGGFVAHEMGIPTVVLGPGEIETQAHQPNESVAVEQLCDSARAYVLLASRVVASPGL